MAFSFWGFLPMRATLLAVLLIPSLAFGAGKTKVAVMDIRALGTEPDKAELLSEIVLSELSGYGKFDVVGKSDISSMLGFERQKALLGCSETGCMAEIGGALGVNFVVMGSLGKLGKLYRVDLKLIDSQRSRVIGRFGENVDGSEESLISTVQRLTRKLADKLAARLEVAAEPTAPEKAPAPAKAVAKQPAMKAPPPETQVVQTKTTTPGAVAEPAVQAEASTRPEVSKRSKLPYIVTGAGGAMLVSGAVAGVMALSSYNAEKKASEGGDLAGYESAKSSAKTRSLVADALLGAGLLTAGVGAYLWLTSGPSDASAVAVHPSAGSTGLGVVLTGGF